VSLASPPLRSVKRYVFSANGALLRSAWGNAPGIMGQEDLSAESAFHEGHESRLQRSPVISIQFPGAIAQAGIESALSALNTYVKRQVLDRRLTQTPYNRLAADGVAFCSRPSIESDAMTQSHLLKDCARNQRKLPVLFPSAVAGTPCQSVRAVASLLAEWPGKWRFTERSGGDASDTDGKPEGRASRARASQTPYNCEQLQGA